METRMICLLVCLCLQLMSYPRVLSLNGASQEKTRDQMIHFVDYDPEFLVSVKGINEPLCFHMECPADDVIRLIQDPVTDVVVNARVIRQGPSNKTYLGAIMVSHGPSFKILAKQRVVVVNEQKYEWTTSKAINLDGNRVVVGSDMVAVTFGSHRITLVVRRHFKVKGKNDNPVITASTHSDFEDDNANNNDHVENEDDDESLMEATNHRADESGESVYNHDEHMAQDGESFYLRTSRADMHNFPSRRKRYMGKTGDIRSYPENIDTQFKSSKLHLPRRDDQSDAVEARLRMKVMSLQYPTNIRIDHNRARKGLRAKWRGHREHKGENQLSKEGKSEHSKRSGIAERKKYSVTFFGVYISDSTDFSNETHGLLGQFLHTKRIKLGHLKRYRNGNIRAKLQIVDTTNKTASVSMALETNDALKTRRVCWRVRHHWREIIDGEYQDYTVPSLRYRQMKQLPPHAPL